MRGNRSADIRSGAMNDVEHAIRQTGFDASFAQKERRHRRELARFRNRSISDGNGRRDFPAEQVERQIPRRDEAGDPARLAKRVIERNTVRNMRLAFGVQNRRRKKSEVCDCSRNIERARETDGLAGIYGFCASEFIQVALD